MGGDRKEDGGASRRSVGGLFGDILLAGRFPLVPAVATALAGAVFVVHALHFWGMTVDDAAISFTYARNLVAGEGLVLQPGAERVEAYSNLLWVLLLAGGRALGADLVEVAKVLGLAFGLATVAGVAVLPALLHRRRPRLTDSAAALALAGNTAFAVWSVAGLENTLFALLVLVTFATLMAESRSARARPWSAGALTLLCMARPEGPAYVVAAVFWRLIRWARDPTRKGRAATTLRWLALVSLGVAIPVAFRRWYFGYSFSNAYYIKNLTWPFSAWHLIDPGSSGWRYVTGFLRAYGLAPLTLLIPASLLDRKHWDVHALGILLLSAGLVFPIYVQGDWMPEWRFMTLVLPLYFFLAGEGLWTVVADLGPRPSTRRGGVALAVLAIVGLVGFVLISVRKPVERTPSVNPDRFTDLATIVERGRYFGEMAERVDLASPTLLDPDLGGTSYSGTVEVVDLFGLGDLSLSRHRWRPPLVREYLFGERRPSFIHLHGAWFGAYHLHEYPEVRDRYVRLSNRSPQGRRVEGRNWIRKDLLAAPWRPVPRAQVVQWDGGVVRLLGVDGGPDVVAPGADYRLDTVFTLSRPTVWNYEGVVLTLPPAVPVRGAWEKAPAVLVSREYRPYDDESGELVLAFRCPARPRRAPRLVVRLVEPSGPGTWDVPGAFVAPPGRWQKGAECLWRGTVVAPQSLYDLDLAWWSGRGAPWRRRIEAMDTRVGTPSPLTFAFGLYPTQRWEPGDRVVGRARLPMPRTVTEGRRRVLLALRQALGTGARGAGVDFVTASSGTAYVEIGEIDVGDEIAEAAFRRLEGRVGAALAGGRLGEADLALGALASFDDGAGRLELKRATQGWAAASLTRAISLREFGDLKTAATVVTGAHRIAPTMPAVVRVRAALADDLHALGERARQAGDVDRAFEAFRDASTLAPQDPRARRAVEELRPWKSAHYDPGDDADAWEMSQALTRLPTEERLEETLIALARAGLHREAVALCPASACGMLRGASGRHALARSYRRLGYLVEAAGLLDPVGGGPRDLDAKVLRHEVLALLGRQIPPGEVHDIVAAVSGGTKAPLGPWAELVGRSVRRTKDGQTEITFYVSRQARAVHGPLEVSLEATGASGSRRVRRIVDVSPAPLVAIPVRLTAPTGAYDVSLSVEGHGSAGLQGVRIDGADWALEAEGWQGWRSEGVAFGVGPVEGVVGRQQEVTGWRGMRLANSYHGGDASTGRLASAPFVVDRPTLEFLLGGGRHPGRAEVRLMNGGQIVRRATGRQQERLRRVRWDVSDLQGKSVTVEVVDEATGPWGHILFDDLRLTGSRAIP